MVKILNANCLMCRTRSDIFSALSEAELQKIDCDKVNVHYNAGEIIFKQGTPCQYMVCITAGLVKCYIEDEKGHNIILGFAKPVNYLLMPGAFVDRRHHYTALASEETTACLVDIDVMHDLIKHNTAFALEFVKKISAQTIELFDKISCFTRKHVYGRMADVILYLSNQIYNSQDFELTISRQDLADLSGMTKESAIRVMRKFKDDKLITLEGNHLVILDMPKLEAISRNG
jgi:CRP/FNR family transcriptional regulator, polysaccharide utilization system transcription regulator